MSIVLAALLLGVSASPPPEEATDADEVAGTSSGSPRPEKDGDEEEARIQPNSTIVVTAHRLDSARMQIDVGLGASVYSLTNDTIEDRPGGETGSLSDILTQAPGVTQSGTTLIIRGSPANQVRINNVIVPEAVSDPADLLSSRLAETTRLITGTLPAQFGFAPAGVISITTKNGLYQHGGEVELFGATDGMIEPAFEWAGSAGATSLFASGELEHGHSRVAGVDGNSARDLGTGIDGLGFADHVIDQNNRLSVIVGGAHERHEIGATTIRAGTETNDNAFGVATYQHSNGGFTLQTSLFAGIGSDEAKFIATTHERRSSWGTQIDGAYTIGESQTIRFGLLATRSAARGVDQGGYHSSDHRTSVGLYAQDEWKLVPSLTVNPGVRIEWLGGLGSGANVEPRASIVWRSPNGLTAHAGYARYASAPPLGEQMNDRPLPDERDDYLDGGVQRKFGALTLGIDGYWRSVHDYISEHQMIGAAVPTAFEFSRARIGGIELSSTYGRGATSIWVNVSLSRAEGRDIIGGEGLFDPLSLAATAATYVPLTSDRPVTATGGFIRRVGRFTLGSDVLVSSGAVRTLDFMEPNAGHYPPYALLGLAAVYHASLAGHAVDLRLDLTDLTNVHYALSDAANLEGGWTRWGRGRAITIGIEEGF